MCPARKPQASCPWREAQVLRRGRRQTWPVARQERLQGQAPLRGDVRASASHPPSGGIGGGALLADRPMDERGKQAEHDAHPPDEIVGAIEIVEFPAEPDTEEGSDLMA